MLEAWIFSQASRAKHIVHLLNAFSHTQRGYIPHQFALQGAACLTSTAASSAYSLWHVAPVAMAAGDNFQSIIGSHEAIRKLIWASVLHEYCAAID
jgi:hypothetical protein